MPDRRRKEVVAEAVMQRRTISSGTVSLVVLGLAAAAYCLWILSLPLFPSQDGPMHLYFIRILQALLLHRDPGLFPRYFYIKNLFPPYALYYYLLLGLSNVVPLVMADKLIVCLYVVVFLFGFRYLARSLGPAGDAMAVLAAAYALNWPLFMGFVNFCLSAGLGCWALGLWCRTANRPLARGNRLRLAGFVALCFACMMTHPVPLLWVLGFCGLEYGIRLARLARGGQPPAPGLARSGVALLLAACTLIYIKLFTTSHIAAQNSPDATTYREALSKIVPAIEHLATLDLFAAHTPFFVVHRALLAFGIVAGFAAGALAVRESLKARSWTLANTWFLLAVLLLATLPVMPPDLNNSHFFSARLALVMVLCALLSGCGWAPPRAGGLLPERLTLALASGLAAVAVAMTVMGGIWRITPLARDVARLEEGPPAPAGQVYLMLTDPDYFFPKNVITFDPYLWSSARLIRRSDSILYNTPWLDLAIIPLGAQPTMANGKVSQEVLDLPNWARIVLTQDAAARQLIFPPVDAVVIDYGYGRAPRPSDPLLALDPVSGRTWACGADAFLTVCRPKFAAPQGAPARR